MRRDFSRLSGHEFDVLVIGGGIYGLATAYDAAQRGLTVALVERSDFGAATSFNHLKTIHGGLRYLQTADFARMRESIRERRAFARIAPRFVAPLAFAMPTGGSLTRSPAALRAAFAIDSVMGFDRHRGLERSHYLPRGRVVSANEATALFEGALGRQSQPAAVWYDYHAVNADRLTLAFALAAAGNGAVLVNYAEAIELRRSDARVTGARVRDGIGGTVADVDARITVNAAGPWAGKILSDAGAGGAWPLLKAMNLVISRPARPAAVAAASRSGRALVMVPWRDRTIIGTSESNSERSPDDQAASRAEVAGFLEEINETFPGMKIQLDEVTLVHRGVVPAARKGGRLTLAGRSRVIDHERDGVQGLISIVGVKYTTARAVAERTVDLLLESLGKRPVACLTATTVLPGAALTDKDSATPVVTAITDEMALTLTDALVRRAGLGAAGYPGDELATGYAAVMQRALDWSESQTRAEIDALKDFFTWR